MASAAPGLCLAAVAAVCARALATGEINGYLGPLGRTLLWCAVPIVAAFGLWQAWDALGSGPQDGGHDDRHRDGHVGGPRLTSVGALVLAPLLVLAVIAPDPLGAFALGRTLPSATLARDQAAGDRADLSDIEVAGPAAPSLSTRVRSLGSANDTYPALSGDPAQIDVYQYVLRTAWGGMPTLTGRTLTLDGFVADDPDRPSGPWVLARLKITCCVADALPYVVTAVDAPAVKRGQWVRVTATAMPNDERGDARMKVLSVTPIQPPKDPYLS